MELVLLYQIKNTPTAAALKPILLRMKLRARVVEPGQYLLPVGRLAGNPSYPENPEIYEGEGFAEPMLIMAGFTEKRLDLFLREMRRAGVRIPLKAIVTAENAKWTSLELYRELRAEREAILCAGKSGLP